MINSLQSATPYLFLETHIPYLQRSTSQDLSINNNNESNYPRSAYKDFASLLCLLNEMNDKMPPT
jgi:hypothetical protein